MLNPECLEYGEHSEAAVIFLWVGVVGLPQLASWPP